MWVFPDLLKQCSSRAVQGEGPGAGEASSGQVPLYSPVTYSPIATVSQCRALPDL